MAFQNIGPDILDYGVISYKVTICVCELVLVMKLSKGLVNKLHFQGVHELKGVRICQIVNLN